MVKLECTHCRDVLGLQVWKYAARVCERNVCAVCRARCKAEWHRSLGMLDGKETETAPVVQEATNDKTNNANQERLGDGGVISATLPVDITKHDENDITPESSTEMNTIAAPEDPGGETR
jgi:hypothetical protein